MNGWEIPDGLCLESSESTNANLCYKQAAEILTKEELFQSKLTTCTATKLSCIKGLLALHLMKINRFCIKKKLYKISFLQIYSNDTLVIINNTSFNF